MNNNINQPDSEALIMISNGSLDTLQLISKVMKAIQNKQQIPNISFEFNSIIKKVKEGFERYVNSKIDKIQLFTEHFSLLNHDVTGEKKDLENFLEIWRLFQLRFYNFNIYNPSSIQISKNEIIKFQNVILLEGNVLFDSLKRIENGIELRTKDIIQTSASLQSTIDPELLKVLLE